MGIQGSIGNSKNDMRDEKHKETEEPQSTSLDRQGSIYDLTLDEIQHHLGDLEKPLNSMNLDELLKTVWTADVNQVGSGFVDLESSELSKKTVDEMWGDIQQGLKKSKSNEKKVLGEMTLEDFLVKAGVVFEPIQKKILEDGLVIDSLAFSQQSNLMNYQIPSVNNELEFRVFVQNPMLDSVFPDPAIAGSPTGLMGTLSNTQIPGRKRTSVSGFMPEKQVERRQKRMIKNRESAARSRARKQAYTNELEMKVTRLEEENEKLKQQNEVEQLLTNIPLPEPKYQLRRTTSALF